VAKLTAFSLTPQLISRKPVRSSKEIERERGRGKSWESGKGRRRERAKTGEELCIGCWG